MLLRAVASASRESRRPGDAVQPPGLSDHAKARTLLLNVGQPDQALPHGGAPAPGPTISQACLCAARAKAGFDFSGIKPSPSAVPIGRPHQLRRFVLIGAADSTDHRHNPKKQAPICLLMDRLPQVHLNPEPRSIPLTRKMYLNRRSKSSRMQVVDEHCSDQAVHAEEVPATTLKPAAEPLEGEESCEEGEDGTERARHKRSL